MSWQDLVAYYAGVDLQDLFIELGIQVLRENQVNLKIASLSQWILESGRGTSGLAQQYFNFAGLKWRDEMQGFATKQWYKAHDGGEYYCHFSTVEAFVKGYWKFITRAPYQGWEKHSSSSHEYIWFIGEIYAPQQNYRNKVSALFPEAQSLLNISGSSIASRGSNKVVKPQVTWNASPNFTSGRGADIDTIFIHNTYGSFGGAISWFQQKQSQVSAHYVISRQGEIVQMVKDEDTAWHAGNRHHNHRSIGIEHEATETERGMTAAMELASIALCRWLMAKYEIPVAKVLPHRSDWGGSFNTSCPHLIFATNEEFIAWREQLKEEVFTMAGKSELTKTATWLELFRVEGQDPILAAWSGSDPHPVAAIATNHTTDLIQFLKEHSRAGTFLVAPVDKPPPNLVDTLPVAPAKSDKLPADNLDLAKALQGFSEAIVEAVQRQINRISKYSENFDLNVKTRYFSQRDNYTMPHRTCNSSANACYLDWLKRSTGQSGLKGDNEYLKVVLSYGDTIYHQHQTKAIRKYGFDTKWMTDRDYVFVQGLIRVGFPVVVNILHRGSTSAPRGGHVITLIGQKGADLICHDPYGTLESGYSDTNGSYSKISEREFKIRWQGGYRTLA
ncbi:MAG: hypothetical protein F6K21_03480 [Symploca sp. SIO2D2]|nr:hypothetical protein [Symploca sp. SIO2D2]